MHPPRLARAFPRGGGILLMPAAAASVHQLRYWLAYGHRADAELAAQGHSYLHSLVPWTVLAIGVGSGVFLRRLAAARRTGAAGAHRVPAAALWLGAWLGLLAVYVVQESLEELLAMGHPGGLAGVVEHGGWWAVPAAAAVALVVTLLLLAGRALLELAAGAAAATGRWRPTQISFPAGVAAAVVRPLARAGAGRAPPLALPLR